MKFLGIALWVATLPLQLALAIVSIIVVACAEWVESLVFIILHLLMGETKTAKGVFLDWYKSYRDLFVKKEKK